MADLISMLAACAGGGEKDPDFNQTVLLLHGDGTNGAQNNTFLDSSTNNFTITRNGNTTQGTFSPFSLAAGEWSNFFDGSGDYLQLANSTALQLGGGAFTIEAWIYPTASGTYRTIIAKRAGGTAEWEIGLNNTDNKLYFYTSTLTPTSNEVTLNAWNHVAASFDGTTLRLYINGVEGFSGTNTVTNSTNITRIGAVSPFTADFQYFPGYISNVRVVKGTAVYTSNFTPPTTPLTAITNTSLLTCQSNRFVDNSTNAFTITRNGDVRVTPFSPFAPTAAYSAGTNGGSGYFDGAGDYLNFTEFSSATDFTCECWFYRGPNVSARHTLFGGNRTVSTARNCQLAVSNGGGIVVILNDAVVTNFNDVGGNVVPRDSWNHIAYVRSSTTISVFVNGTRIATGTSSATLYVTQVGAYIDSLGAAVCNGYISSARVTNTAVYDPSQTTLTVPTAPLTAISGTSLLLNFTNAGIFDNTGKNNLETVGNAQIDTTTKKYGTGSLEFDGTGDYLLGPYNPDFNFDTGDFTIECWIYLNSIPVNADRVIAAFGTSSSSQRWILLYDTRTITSAPHLAFYSLNSSNAVTVEVKGGGSSGWSANTWYHVAITRQGTSFKLFRDGVQNGSTVTDSDPVPGTAASTGSLFVGAEVGGSLAQWNGFIDDLRITKGVARYTAAFTPPTAAFPNE